MGGEYVLFIQLFLSFNSANVAKGIKILEVETMSQTDNKTDKEKGDEVLKRMLKTPPKPNEKNTKSGKVKNDETKST